MDSHYVKLRLCAPLTYKKIENNDDFCINLSKNDDYLQCYEINPQQGSNIEPNQELFLGSHIFSGLRIEEKTDCPSTINQGAGEEENPAQEVILPQGTYLLVQRRSDRLQNRSEWLDMAIEQQKDGLWEQNKLGSLLYVRCLHEDGQFVTQVFRQVV